MDDRNDRKAAKDRSWREVDKIRESSHARERDPMLKQSSPQMMNAQRNYRAALEKAFAAGTLGELAKTLTNTGKDEERKSAPSPAAAAPASASGDGSPDATPQPMPQAAPRDPDRENRQKLLAKIRESEGRDPINRAIDAFLAKYPKLPDDYEILTKALSHKDDDRVRTTIDQLGPMITREKPRRGRALIAQLRMLEDTHSDGEIRTLAAAIRGRL